MLRRSLLIALTAVACAAGAVTAEETAIILPSGWRLTPPQGAIATTGTMPQGIALSPDGQQVAVVESGVGPAYLRIFDAATLQQRAAIHLQDAFGSPIWRDASHVLVAGGAAHAVFDVDVSASAAAAVPLEAGTYAACVARSNGGQIAICDDTGSVVVTALHAAAPAWRVSVGAHPSAAIFSSDGKTIFAAVRGTNTVAVIDTASHAVTAQIRVGRHPAALLRSQDGSKLYVAESDDDSVGIVDLAARRRTGGISVELRAPGASGFGASPNALALRQDDIFVSLGAENAVARIHNGSLAERIPAGWYPTGVAVSDGGRLFVSNGRGEQAPANPQFDPRHGDTGYVGLITTGSLRAIDPAAYANTATETRDVAANAASQFTRMPAGSIVHAGGPIRHVIYVIKENRSYDQVLGDLPAGNGDPSLVWFGKRVTPNQHAIAARFGVFDNAYVDAQVSANGHNWTDAAFANDYVERFWPPNYGGRRKLYDFQQSDSPDVPHGGYLWDAARRAGITYRDYGEDLDAPENAPVKMAVNTMPGLTGHFDPRFIGFDLSYMDDDRYAEWSREFRAFEANGDLPQLEIVYFPGDHTAGTAPGMRTPAAYVAMNDWAVGRLVQDVSHSRYWRSTAIFFLEDDAQNGPDHVSDQRSTFYIASPYARGGVMHEHYSTAGFVRTIELLLGLHPLSIYDDAARPLYAAFSAAPSNAAPFTAVRPAASMNELNGKQAYGAAISAHMDLRRPDAADPRVLNDILAHAVHYR